MPSPTAALRTLLTLSLLIAAAPRAAAQGMSVLSGGGSSGTVLVERDAVESRARASFAAYVERKVREANEPTDRVREAAEQTREDYESALGAALDALEGDGLLSASETDDGLSSLREDYESELETVVTALRDGHEPPPRAQEAESGWHHTWELARYTFAERNEPLRWLWLGVAVAGGMLLAWGLIRGARRIARELSNRDRGSAAHAVESVSGPLYLAAVALGVRIGLLQIWVPAKVRGPLLAVITALLAAALFWVFWNLCPVVARATVRFLRRSYGAKFDDHLAKIIERFLKLCVLAGLVLVVVQLILDTSLASLFAGLGILGLALYFVLRGTIENIAASFTIFGDEPFRVGDLIVLEDQWGHVEEIGFRSTRVRLLKGHVLTVPNATIVDSVVHNVGVRPSIRRRFRIGIVYETPPEKVEEAISILHDILDGHAHQPEDQEVRVELEGFAAYTLDLFVEYHYAPAEFYEALAFDTEVNLEILKRFDEAGIEFAFPTETHVVTTPEGEDAPRFEVTGAGLRAAAGGSSTDSRSEPPAPEASEETPGLAS